MAKENKKKKKWIRARHRIVRVILGPPFHLYCKLRYGVNIKRFREEGKRQYLVLFNHQTAFDQFFAELSFKQHLYFLASEDIFSKGFLSSALRYLVAPIPIKKQTTDVRAIMNCIRVAKEGGSIALSPEGNRTFAGRTGYMSPAIASLARKLGLPIALYHIKGGYGVQPRWADNVRRGKMECYVHRVIEPEEYSTMTDAELFKVIEEGLYIDEARVDGTFRHKNSAEHLERLLYVCPHCGLTTFETYGNIIECKKCHTQVRHLPTKELEGVSYDCPYRFVADWYDAQCEFVSQLDIEPLRDEPIWSETASFFEVIPNKKKQLICKNARVCLFGDKIHISTPSEEYRFDFAQSEAVTVLGRNKVNIYFDGKIYQLKGSKSFNGIKYVNLFNHCKNLIRGELNGKFLGL